MKDANMILVESFTQQESGRCDLVNILESVVADSVPFIFQPFVAFVQIFLDDHEAKREQSISFTLLGPDRKPLEPTQTLTFPANPQIHPRLQVAINFEKFVAKEYGAYTVQLVYKGRTIKQSYFHVCKPNLPE